MSQDAPQRFPHRSLLRFEPTPKALVLVVLTIGAVWLAMRLLPVIFVVVVALLLVGTLNPAVDWLEKKGCKRGLGIGLVFFAMVLVSVVVMVGTIPALIDQVAALVEEVPTLRIRAADALGRSSLTAPVGEYLQNVKYDALARSAAGSIIAYASRFVTLVAYLASTAFLALYIMIDRDRLRGGLFALVPRTHHVRLSRVLLNLETIVGGYIRGQALTSLLFTVFTFVLLALCRVPHALVIAVFAGLADILPYIGVFFSVGPALIASVSRGPVIVAIVLVAMIGYEELESRLLIPKIYGKALRLPSSVVLVALLAGGTLSGMAGALLALPAAAAVRMLLEELRVALPGEQVDDAGLRERDERAEQEYERRADGTTAKEAASIAVEISEERRREERSDAVAAETPITSGTRSRGT